METSVLEKKLNKGSIVNFYEGKYGVREISTEEDLLKSYRLRHEIFCGELRWVPPNPEMIEIDNYDEKAISFGVFNPQNKLASYLRLLTAEGEFMIEQEFAEMVSAEHSIRHDKDTAEISRLCIAQESRRELVSTEFEKRSTSVVILKGIYHWCKANSVRYLYAVTEYKIYRLACAKGFPFKLIGAPKAMPDGVVAVAMLLDWEEFEFINTLKRPELLKWFSLYRSIPTETQSPLHESCLQRQVFALANQHGN